MTKAVCLLIPLGLCLAAIIAFAKVSPLQTAVSIQNQRVKVEGISKQVDQQQKVVDGISDRMEHQGGAQPSGQAAGQVASISETQNEAQTAGAAIADLQAQIAQKQREGTDQTLALEDQNVQEQVDREQTLKSVQTQLQQEQARVSELNNVVDKQEARNLETDRLDTSVQQAQQEKERLQALLALHAQLEIQARDDSAAEDLSLRQQALTEQSDLAQLQGQLQQEQRSYQSLLGEEQTAQAQGDKRRAIESDLEDRYTLEHEKLLDLEDRYSNENAKLSQMEATSRDSRG
jgi:hypothetical protein